MAQTPNERFYEMSALSRVESYFAIFAAWLALRMCRKPPPHKAAGTLVAMAVQRFGKQTITPKQTVFQKHHLENFNKF